MNDFASELERRIAVDPVGYLAAARRPSRMEAYLWRRWCEWCAVNGQPPAPATAKLVRIFLHSQQRRWGPATMDGAARAIAARHARLGHEEPTRGMVQQYLAAMRRASADLREVQLDPIRSAEARALVERAPSYTERAMLADRVLVAAKASRAGGVDLATVCEGLVEARDDACRVRHPTSGAGRLLANVGGAEEPHVLAAARRLVEASAGEPARLGPLEEVAAELQACARRARLRLGRKPRMLEALCDADLDWLLDWRDPQFLRSLRDRTYLVVGVDLGRRAIEMGRFDLGDFARNPDGSCTVSVANPKGYPPGTVLTQPLDHVWPEHPWCPACSFEIWRRVLAERYGYERGAAFPSRVGGRGRPTGRVTTPLSRLIVKRLWEESHPVSDRYVGSRSMRIGRSTEDWERGMDLDEIASVHTLHRCFDATAVYVRRSYPSLEHYRMDV